MNFNTINIPFPKSLSSGWVSILLGVTSRYKKLMKGQKEEEGKCKLIFLQAQLRTYLPTYLPTYLFTCLPTYLPTYLLAMSG
jgi:hypothetical protein